MQLHYLPCLLWLSLAIANVEKTIFLGPPETSMPNDGPGLSHLCLESLAPSSNGSDITKLRTLLPVRFPTTEKGIEQPKGFRGLQAWYILKDLTAGQRYEVRICWSATQPTDFHLATYTLKEVFDTPSLITNLAQYSEPKIEKDPDACLSSILASDSQSNDAPSSVLLLKIDAIADFFSSNKTRMEYPPDVLVDIILDPYKFNIIPSSLIPVGLYIVVVAIFTFYLSGFIYRWIQQQVQERPSQKQKES